ncbi:MAG: serine/threonine-protein kinase, partial [Acidobacteriota bacterium]
WIARIFDGGTTEGGVPYLVMEMIDGQPIDRYCEAHDLSVRQRIELFRQICSAVHYSHQNLVVHCDLKPSNILVDTSGAPKLLDFGIAKLLQQGSAGDRDDPTTLGSRPLTPEYASPEQFRGEALSTVSDVYSLGVLLYKLLTGQRPATAERLSRPAADDDIAPPSAATRDRSPDLSRRLRGDLDAIVLKALRASPDERFGSAAQLSEDLGRYLEGFPVHARQGNLSYRAKRFLRRHRLAVSAAIVSFAVLGFFAFSMASLAGRLTEEQAKLQEVVGFFRLFFERAGPLVSQGRNLTLREAVDQNAAMIVDGLADQPAVKVEIATVLGDIYRELGQPEQALAWSDRALELHRQLAGEDSHAYSLGLVRLGAALRELGRYEEAEAKIRDGLDRLRAHSDTEPAQLVDSLNNLVSLLCYEERYQEAVDHSIAALSLAEDQLGDTAIETMTAIANRGLVLRQLGQAGEAKRLYERAIALFRHRLGGSHPLVATLLLNLSSIERDQGDLAMAENTLEEANQQYLEMFGREHYGRIRPLVGLAKLAARQQRVDEAVERYREAIEVAIASQAPPPFVLRPTLDL